MYEHSQITLPAPTAFSDRESTFVLHRAFLFAQNGALEMAGLARSASCKLPAHCQVVGAQPTLGVIRGLSYGCSTAELVELGHMKAQLQLGSDR